MTGMWEPLAVGSGGSVVCLASARQEDGSSLIFAATALGLFVSSDEGQCWQHLETTFASPAVDVVAASPDFARDRTIFAGSAETLYVSRDGGNTWRACLRGSRMNALALSPSFGDDHIVLVGTETDGVLRSEDAGNTWKSVNPGLLELTVNALLLSPNFDEDQTAFVATSSALYRTRNGGQSWREVDTGLVDADIQCVATSPMFAEDRVVLAGTASHGLLRSQDAGTTWDGIETLPAQSIMSLASFPLIDREPGFLAGTGSGIACSDDLGTTWSNVEPEQSIALSLLHVPVQNNYILIAGLLHDAISRSSDEGRTWQRDSRGLAANLLTTMVASPRYDHGRTLYAVDLERGILASTDAGVTWHERNRGISASRLFDIDATLPDAVFTAGTDGVYRSIDSAMSWDRVLASETPVMAITASSAGERSKSVVGVALHDGRVLLGTAQGSDWRELSTVGGDAISFSLAISPDFEQDGTILLSSATVDNDSERYLGELLLSTDHGSNWTPLLSGQSTHVLPLALSPDFSNDRTIYAGLGRAFHEIVLGREQVQVACVDAGTAITDISIISIPGQRNTIVISGNTGIFRCTSLDEGFRDWSTGLDRPAIVSLTNTRDETGRNVMYAVGLGGVIYRQIGN